MHCASAGLAAAAAAAEAAPLPVARLVRALGPSNANTRARSARVARPFAAQMLQLHGVAPLGAGSMPLQRSALLVLLVSPSGRTPRMVYQFVSNSRSSRRTRCSATGCSKSLVCCSSHFARVLLPRASRGLSECGIRPRCEHIDRTDGSSPRADLGQQPAPARRCQHRVTIGPRHAQKMLLLLLLLLLLRDPRGVVVVVVLLLLLLSRF